MTEIHVDTSDVDRELDRLERLDRRTILALDAVLTGQYAATQVAVHIETGSLKTSGRHDSNADRHTWRGEIVYGGPAPGAVNNPVDYAIYEKARGGHHDFIAPAVAQDEAYGAVVLDHLRGDL